MSVGEWRTHAYARWTRRLDDARVRLGLVDRNSFTAFCVAVFFLTLPFAWEFVATLVAVLTPNLFQSAASEYYVGRYGIFNSYSVTMTSTLLSFPALAALALLLTLRSDPLTDIAGKNFAELIRKQVAASNPTAIDMFDKIRLYYERIGGSEILKDKVVFPSATHLNSFYEPRDARMLQRAISAAVRKVASKLVPSNLLFVMSVLVLLSIQGWLCLEVILTGEYDANGQYVGFRWDWIVIDQIVKGFVVDISEYFHVPGWEYKLPHEIAPHWSLKAIVGTVILFSLRTIPALAFFKGLQLYQQRDAVEAIVGNLTVIQEEELLRMVTNK